MSNIKYPEMRKELVGHLQALADPEYQQRVWVEGGSEGAIQHDEFDYAVHFLYDDTQLAKDPRSTIGSILRDTWEADRIETLVSAIEGIFQKYGTELSDAQYIELPEWLSVVGAAREALAAVPG